MSKSMNKQQIVLLAVLVALLVSAAGYWVFHRYYEYYEEPVDNGYSNRYYQERWLAADRFLEERGVDTTYHHRVPEFDSLPTDQTLFGGNVVNLLTRGQTRDLLNWVEAGGHLIFTLTSEEEGHLSNRLGVVFADYYYDDYEDEEGVEEIEDSASDSCSSADDEAADTEDCDYPKWWDDEQVTTVNFDGNDDDYQLVLPHYYGLEHRYIYDEEYADDDSATPFYWAGSESAGTNFMQFYVGDGLITVTTNSHLWYNQSITNEDAAHVLGILATGKLNVLEQGNVPTLFEILWRYASELIVAAAVLLLLWIAHHIRRFGPVLTDNSLTRRSLSDHIAASAAHHWKLKNTSRLIHPLQKQLQRAAVKHRPGFGGLTREQQTLALIEVTGLPDALCHAAMDVPQTSENEFVKQVSALKTLIERLNQGQ